MPAPDYNLIKTLVDESLDLLEWPVLAAHLIERCQTPLGCIHWQSPAFSENVTVIRARLAESDDLLRLIQREGGLPASITERPFAQILPALQRLGKSATLSLAEWTEIFVTLHQGRQWMVWLRRQLSEQPLSGHPAAWRWLKDLQTPEETLTLLTGKLTLDGEVPDSASPTLAELRDKYRRQQKQLTQLLDQLLSRMGSLLNEGYHTQRNGRHVFPVAATHKASVAGVLHDSSASGQTLYIEPQAVIEPHNRLLATEHAITEEIAHTLAELTTTLAPHASELAYFVESLGRLDALWAGAALGHRLRATVPKVNDPLLPSQFNLLAARHPLLLLKSDEPAARSSVIANDIRLGPEQRTLVITGPNTGGKTVALKTVGLCALMVRAGLPIPVKAGSSISLLAAVLADLGDAQSLTQNLSTFSGHIRRQAGFVAPEAVLSQALVLIDEIGAGTDPVEGAALATVLLKALYDKGALSLVTTHLSALKWEAHQQAGYLNASMLFDLETLSPTYQLMLGVPGTSHALTIAQRLGVPAELIGQAQLLMAQTERDSTALLVDLEARRVTTEADQSAVTQLRQELEDRAAELKEEVQSLRENKKRLILEYRAGLKQRFVDVEAQLKQIRKHLRAVEEEPSPGQARLAGARLRHVERAADAVIADSLTPLDEAAAPVHAKGGRGPEGLAAGQAVLVVSMNQRGEVEQVSADGKKVQLRVAGIRLTVSVRDVQVVQGTMTAEAAAALKAAERKQIVRRIAQTPTPRMTSAPVATQRAGLECDLRGQRVEDALTELERYLDAAMVAGHALVGVIHGQGTGALKRAVREYLGAQPFVRRFYPDEARHGGDGKTVIELG